MEEKPSTARVALKWGLIAGVTSMVFATVLYVTGQFANNSLAWLGILFSVLFIFLAIKEYRTLNHEFVSYGEGVGLGTLVSVISGLISSTYSYIYTNFIDPTIPEQMMERMQADMEDRGMSDEQIEQALEFSKMFASPGITFAVGIVGAALIGLIISLIVAAFMRRNRSFEEMS